MIGLLAVDEWLRAHVAPVGTLEIVHDRPWATVMRVPLSDGVVWFKACAPVQAFEPRLTAELFTRWPDRVAEVRAYDAGRAWLLLADAGTPMGALGNPPDVWLSHCRATPSSNAARLRTVSNTSPRASRTCGSQHSRRGTTNSCGSTSRSIKTKLGGCGTSRLARRPVRETCRLQRAGDDPARRPSSREPVCAGRPVPRSRLGRRVHRASVRVPRRHLPVPRGGLRPHARRPVVRALRDAYLEPWGSDLRDTFTLAFRVGTFARPIAYIRQRAALASKERRDFDSDFTTVLRRAVAQTSG